MTWQNSAAYGTIASRPDKTDPRPDTQTERLKSIPKLTLEMG